MEWINVVVCHFRYEDNWYKKHTTFLCTNYKSQFNLKISTIQYACKLSTFDNILIWSLKICNEVYYVNHIICL